MGERTGKKANPEEIERQMRNARNERNERLFQREEWLTKTQRIFFFHASLHGRELAVRMLYQRNRHFILQQMRMTTSTPSLENLIATICLTIFKAELGYSIWHMIFAPTTRKESYRPSMLQWLRLFFGTLKYLSEQKIERLLTEVIQECNCWKESTVPFIKQKGQQYFFL